MSGYYSVSLQTRAGPRTRLGNTTPGQQHCCGSTFSPDTRYCNPYLSRGLPSLCSRLSDDRVSEFSLQRAGFSFLHTAAAGRAVLDGSPPGRVTDLRVALQSDTEPSLQLQWTAVGGDWDAGAADSYAVVCSIERKNLLEINIVDTGNTSLTQP